LFHLHPIECFTHFEGGDLNSVPTVVPRTVRPTINKPRSNWNNVVASRDPAMMELTTSNSCAYEIEGISMERQLSRGWSS